MNIGAHKNLLGRATTLFKISCFSILAINYLKHALLVAFYYTDNALNNMIGDIYNSINVSIAMNKNKKNIVRFQFILTYC
jgi:hypothetical protein